MAETNIQTKLEALFEIDIESVEYHECVALLKLLCSALDRTDLDMPKDDCHLVARVVLEHLSKAIEHTGAIIDAGIKAKD